MLSQGFDAIGAKTSISAINYLMYITNLLPLFKPPFRSFATVVSNVIIPNLALNGDVNKPDLVVAPINVKGDSSI